MSSVRFASGRARLVGQSLRRNTPVSLDASAYDGGVVMGQDNLLHYSDGQRWVGVAPVLSTLIDAGNAATNYTGGAKIDLGSAQT
jgi:hypothetical protein